MGEVVYSKCAGLASLLEASIYYPYAVIYHDRPVQVSKAHERRIEREREKEDWTTPTATRLRAGYSRYTGFDAAGAHDSSRWPEGGLIYSLTPSITSEEIWKGRG